jgi:DNA-binding FadR family transcriptional regulator
MSQPGPRLYRSRVADQIVEDLRRQILSGELADGAQLPPERELAAYYDVSAPTVREAIRVLTSMGLIKSHNRRPATVIASGDTMMRMSIASVAQFEKMRADDLLSLASLLYGFAVRLAVDHATDADIEELRAAAERTADLTDVRTVPAALRAYFAALTAASHNPMLAAMCKAFTEIHIGMDVDLSGDDSGDWGRVVTSLYPRRIAIVDAIARRDPTAPGLIQEYHERVTTSLRTFPAVQQVTETDPGLTAFLSTWLASNIRSDNAPK